SVAAEQAVHARRAGQARARRAGRTAGRAAAVAGGMSMERRRFTFGTALVGAAAMAPRTAAAHEPVPRKDAPPFEFEEATVTGLQERMARGELTARALTEACLARIAVIVRDGPSLHHVIETNPDAMAIAA